MRFFKIYILVFSFFSFKSFAQQDTLGINTVVAKTTKMLNDFPVEKIYIHTDKPYYAVADTLWFKAYLTENQNFPSQISKVVYVELINQKDSLIQTLKLPAINGFANGQVYLNPEQFKQGNFRLRAYTNWMLNFDDSRFFSKTLFIGEAVNKEASTHITLKNNSTANLDKIDARIKFLNEKGAPLSNKVVNWQVKSGYGIPLKGKVTTDLYGMATISMSGSATAEYPIRQGDLVTQLINGDQDVIEKSFSLQQVIQQNDIQFFPEGGQLIQGLENKLAFKAIRSNGLGIGFTGTIVDQQGQQVAKISSQHLGMGAINFKSLAGKSYKAQITFNDGTKTSLALPVALEQGLVLSINTQTETQFNLKIQYSPNFKTQNAGKMFYVIGQSKGIVCYGAQLELKEDEINAGIPKDKFPTGITQISVLNNRGQVISERLVFIQRPERFNVKLSTAAASSTAKKKMKIDLASVLGDKPVGGHFSLSVIDESKVPFNDDQATTILSNTLLSQDLNGYVEKPNYYFNNQDAKKLGELDLLMLTQGYRTYSYTDILADKRPLIQVLPEEGIEISGILRMNNGLEVRKGAVLLSIPDKRFSKDVVTDPVGRFKFTGLNFNDSSKVTITAKYNTNYRAMAVTLDGQPVPTPGINYQKAEEILNIDSAMNTYLENGKKQYAFLTKLKDVEIKGKAPDKRPSSKDYAALTGLSALADHTLDGSRFQACNFLLQCLQTTIPGVTYDTQELKFFISRDYNAGKRIPMAIFLNGMNVDVNAINTITASEIDNIEIFMRDELGLVNRAYNTNGVISISLKKAPKGEKMSKAQLMDLLPKPYEVTFSPGGYTRTRNFYVPRYDIAANLKINDLRTTVYWNPTVVTNETTGLSSIEFYNTDGRGTYKVVAEGIDANGNVARGILRYSVK